MPPHAKPVRFEERRSVVAVYEQPQADEPPGRGNSREVEVVLYSAAAVLHDSQVARAIATARVGT